MKPPKFMLHVKVVEGKDLSLPNNNTLQKMVKGSQVASYCKAKVRGEFGSGTKYRTRVLHHTDNPVWNDIFSFRPRGFNEKLVLQVKARRSFPLKDLNMGRVSIDLGELVQQASDHVNNKKNKKQKKSQKDDDGKVTDYDRAGERLALHGWFRLFHDAEETQHATGSVYVQIVTDFDYKPWMQKKFDRFHTHRRTLMMQHFAEDSDSDSDLDAAADDDDGENERKQQRQKKQPPKKQTKKQKQKQMVSPKSVKSVKSLRSLTKTRSMSSLRVERPLSVWVGTWNVGNAPPPEDLSPWIPKDGHDLFAIGTQECKYDPPDASKSKFKNMAAKLKGAQEHWERTLRRHFGDAYRVLKYANLGEMRLIVFVRADLDVPITRVQWGSEATGFLDVIPNKGGVAVSMRVHDLSVCFVNSHLAAHQPKTKERNSNVRSIIMGVDVGIPKQDLFTQFHHIVWMGDLNYRLNFGDQGDDKSPSKEQFDAMVKMIEEKKFKELFKYDQLAAEMKEGNVFNGFQEGSMTHFAPTFKVERNERLKYIDKRSPAWCDRIVWKSTDHGKLQQRELNSCLDILTSDHKPVHAVFDLTPTIRPVGWTEQYGECNFWISNLRATDLKAGDLNGKSDPYVVFHSGMFVKSVKTKDKQKTLNPVWEDKDIPPFKMSVNARRRIRKSRIYVQVWDDDMGLNPDDRLACASINMSDFIDAGEAGKQFELQLLRGGLPKGKLYGKIHLVFQDKAFDPALIDHESSL